MLKIGVIGSGKLGQTHIQQLKEIEDFELVGIYDSNDEYANQVAKFCGVKNFLNADELMDVVDVVDIVKPTISHFDYGVKAIKKSKHVFIEKPVTQTLEQAKQLLHLAEEANVKVQIGHVERYNPAFIAALPYISNPTFIEAHRMIEFDVQNANIPVVMDLMSHDLDIILNVVNSNIKKISAIGVDVVGNSPDIVNAVVTFDNGCVANLTASRVSLTKERITKFYQKDTQIIIDYYQQKTTCYSMKSNGQTQFFSEELGIDKVNPVKCELEDFAMSIIHNFAPKIGVLDGYLMLEAAQKIAEKVKKTTSLIED